MTSWAVIPPDVPCQPRESTVHLTPTYPMPLAVPGPPPSTLPNGKRTSGRVSAPLARRIERCALDSSARTWASARVVSSGWVSVWLPTTKPLTATSFAWAGKLRTHWPVRKNVAGTFLVRNVARIEGMASALAPASNVSPTSRELVGIRVQSTPSRDDGGADGAAGTHARDQADHAPLRCQRDHNALSVPRTTTSMPPPAAATTAGASINVVPMLCQPVQAPARRCLT